VSPYEETLALWTEVIRGNAPAIARALVANAVVHIVKDVNGTEGAIYGIKIDVGADAYGDEG
jgi:hypothetical protein